MDTNPVPFKPSGLNFVFLFNLEHMNFTPDAKHCDGLPQHRSYLSTGEPMGSSEYRG